MMLNEQDCVDRINAYTLKDWQPLFALIPRIESTSTFGECVGGDKNEKGYFQLPYIVPGQVVSQFCEIVYGIPIVIGFDWGSWSEGREILSDTNVDFDTCDLVTKCKLITAIVRNDRFCEGALVSAFKSGLILKILKSIEKEVKAENCS